MKISKAERSTLLLSLSLLVGACSAADAAPDLDLAPESPGSGSTPSEVASDDGAHRSVLAQETDAAAPAEPVEPATCPNGKGSLTSGRKTITVGGKSRSYIVKVPSSYNGSKPVPLLVDLHPLLSSGSGYQGISGYNRLADREGFIAVYPDGTTEGANGRRLLGSGWNIGKCCTASSDEAFIRALVEKVKSEACIDTKRVYAAGYSMGGGMSHYLACNAADVFAATAPAAFDLLVENEMPCKPSRPVSVIIFRGTNDPIVKFSGGASSPPNGSPGPIHFEGAENTFKRWASINGCSGSPTSGTGGCRTYGQCKDGVEVTLCVKQGGGHDQGDAQFGWSRLSKYTLP